jgi:hypothetical protein
VLEERATVQLLRKCSARGMDWKRFESAGVEGVLSRDGLWSGLLCTEMNTRQQAGAKKGVGVADRTLKLLCLAVIQYFAGANAPYHLWGTCVRT